jgi:hypothetical protein
MNEQRRPLLSLPHSNRLHVPQMQSLTNQTTLLMGELCSKPHIHMMYSMVCRFLYFEINQLAQLCSYYF